MKSSNGDFEPPCLTCVWWPFFKDDFQLMVEATGLEVEIPPGPIGIESILDEFVNYFASASPGEAVVGPISIRTCT